ncbi:hypothetical protein SGCOL_004206 [Colletotrichum sp. CLE4]
MSRALNKHIIAALKQGDHEKIFNDISGLFAQPQDDGLLEVEILGQGHPMGPDENFLREENAVAIPKLRIVQAFLFARKILQKYKANGSEGREQLMAATSVLLLMDPEHLTAANTRKRLLSDAISTGNTMKAYLTREKWGRFVNVQERLVATSAEDSIEAAALRKARTWWDMYGSNDEAPCTEDQ